MKSMLRPMAALGLVSIALAATEAAFAGSGHVVPGNPSSVPMDCDDQRFPGIDPCPTDVFGNPSGRPGDTSLTVSVRAPLTDPANQLALFEQQFKRANRVLCDVTDGRMRLEHITVTASPLVRDTADVWWSATPLGGFANVDGNIGDLAGRLKLWGYTRGNFSGATIAHELGHYLFGVADAYNAQPTGYQGYGGCGFGPAFDGQLIPGREFIDYLLPQQSPFYDTSLPWDTDRENTIMQQIHQECRDSSLLSAFESDPIFWDALVVQRGCIDDANCAGLGAFTTCENDSRVGTELSVSSTGENNWDLTRATYDFGDVDGLGTVPDCPVMPASEVMLQGVLQPDAPLACGSDANGDGDPRDPELDEECDVGSPLADCGDGTPMPCTGCVYDRSVCSTPATCGNGVVDGTEECDGNFTACFNLGLRGLTAAPCLPNCRFDRTACDTAPFTELPETVADLLPLSPTTRPVSLIDALGSVEVAEEAPSIHGLFVRVWHLEPGRWGVALIMDKGDFDEASEGDALVVGSYVLTFAGTVVADINGRADWATAPPEVVIGSDTDFLEYGTAVVPGVASGQTEPTGLFANGAPPLELTLDVQDLVEMTSAGPGPVRPGSYVNARARVGVIAGGPFNGRDIPQNGACTDALRCRFGWNSTTQRYEATAQTMFTLAKAYGTDPTGVLANPDAFVIGEWETFAQLASTGYGLRVALPTDLPSGPPLAAADCPDPEFFTDGAVTTLPDEIVLVLDRSASMAMPQTQNILAGGQSRLDFAKSAARALLALHSTRATPPKVSLIWFSGNRTGTGIPPAVVPVFGGALRDLVAGSIAPPDTAIGNLIALVAASPSVGTDDLGRFLDSGPPPLPDAAGSTSIGSGLQAARNSFSTAEGIARAVVLLTDGEENNFDPESPTNTVPSPEDELRLLDERDIDLFHVPAGSDAGRLEFGAAGERYSSRVFEARDATELIPAFVQTFASQMGLSLTRHHASSIDAVEQAGGGEILVDRAVMEIPVEAGAGELRVVLSLRRGSPVGPLGTPGYNPQWLLSDPSGQFVTPQVVADAYYRILTVPLAPSDPGGVWELRVDLPPTVAGVEETPEERINTWVTAFADNPGPTCHASFDKGLIVDGETATLTAMPAVEHPITLGAEVTARISRPDKTVVQVPLEYDAVAGNYRAELGSGVLIGRGQYEAVVRCEVGPGARFFRGENPLAATQGAPAPESPFLDTPVLEFRRETSATFYFDSATLPPLPEADDCDGDGILNVDEVDGDTDNDGLPDVCDSDGDGDDIPDPFDPDATDPGLPTPEQCSDEPAAVACCANLGQCSGTRDYVLYADRNLILHDRVVALTSDGQPAVVVNGGVQETNLGVESIVGGVVSNADVEARDRAQITGSVATAGDFIPHADVTVGGSLEEQAVLVFPPLSDFAMEFPPAGADQFLEPAEERDLLPGSHGDVHVGTDAVLHLLAGTYYLRSLILEPDATVTLATSGGPVFLYISNVFVYRGVFVSDEGRHDRLFVGYFGTDSVPVERPFSGTLVAPRANIEIATLPMGQLHRGAFFGMDLTVRPDVIVEHHAFPLSWSLGGMLGTPPEPPPPGPCSATTAFDLGSPGNNVSVPNDGCVKVDSAYPSWWGVRTMKLESTDQGTYPVPFTWTNACAQAGGNGLITGDWQAQFFGPTSDACPTVIDLGGAGDGTVTVRYWAN